MTGVLGLSGATTSRGDGKIEAIDLRSPRMAPRGWRRGHLSLDISGESTNSDGGARNEYITFISLAGSDIKSSQHARLDLRSGRWLTI